MSDFKAGVARVNITPAVGQALYVGEDISQGVADDFLVDALLEADNSGFLSDSLRERIVRGFARSGNYSLAIRTVERMSDHSLRARAVHRTQNK